MMIQATALDTCAMLLSVEMELQELHVKVAHFARRIRSGDLPSEVGIGFINLNYARAMELYFTQACMRPALARYPAANDLDGGGDGPLAA